MVNDESAKLDNIREILYTCTEEYEIKKGRAIYELAHYVLSETSKFDIEYIDLESPTRLIKRQLIVKVYKDRGDCPIGGIAKKKDEPDHYLQKMTQDLQVITQKYSLFVIQVTGEPRLYWVRIE